MMWAALGLLATSAGAVDLESLDRSIRKEPVYVSGEPRYCLLAFGAEADVHVWLVLDGNVLYVDRNGNGDLTEPGERFEPTRVYRNLPDWPDMKLKRLFFLPNPTKKKPPVDEPFFSCVPESRVLIVEHFVPADDNHNKLAEHYRKCPHRVDVATTQCEQDSLLAFATRPENAPILHFDGPRQLRLRSSSVPLRRGETCMLSVDFLTPGLGASLRTPLCEGTVAAHPVAEIEYPPCRPGDEPIRLQVELPGRG
ncbi:MAG: hypothetical protein JW818_04790 [Pirellulales bacterium]|nr:hypothetical protein [Pirellulales bacterium]